MLEGESFMSLKEHNILVVDDSGSWRDLLRRVLEEDYSVTAVGSAQEALKVLAVRDAPIHVAIVDKKLKDDEPDDASGLDLAKDIKSIIADCQIIILTGYEDFETIKRAFKDLRVYDYLRKSPEGGFDNNLLRETVLRAILAAPKLDTSDMSRTPQRPKPETVTILHLSDLHFGKNHRFNRDRRYPRADAPSLQRALITSLDASGKKPDIVVVSGDLTERGDSREFRQARAFLNTLAKHLKLKPTHFTVVPGNHDVRWSEDATDSVSNDRDRLTEYRDFYELLYKQPSIERSPACRIGFYQFEEKPNVAIVGLDSCVIEDSQTAGVGYVGVTQLNNTLEKLKRMTSEETKCIKIAVLHHHLIPVAYLEKLPKEEKNFSLVVDATRVLTRLQEEGFTFILHGHQHQPFCAEIRLPLAKMQNQRPVAIIGMGSVGIKPSPDLVGGTRNNHYGILELSQVSLSAPIVADVSWYRAEGNDPEEAFEMYQDFTLRFDYTE